MQSTNGIVKLSEVTQEQFDQAIEVYVESFYDMMSKTITKDRAKLRAIYAECFDPAQVFVYVSEGRVLGFLGWASAGNHSIKPVRRVITKQLGPWGHFVHWGLNYYQPKSQGDDHGIVEYLAVDPAARGQRVGAKLLQYLCDNLPYRAYTLETTDENTSAVKLYTRMGFVKLPKKLSPLVRGFAKVFKLGTPIYMKLELT